MSHHLSYNSHAITINSIQDWLNTLTSSNFKFGMDPICNAICYQRLIQEKVKQLNQNYRTI